MDAPKFSIRVMSASKPTEGFDLEVPSTFRVGRSVENDLVIDDSKVSRFHAIFSATEQGVMLSDLSSLNGTFVNQRRMTAPVSIAHGDVIQIGGTQIFLHRETHHSGAMNTATDITQNLAMKETEVVALVADVSGYTRLSEQFEPQEVTETLGRWLAVVTEIIDRRQGTVEKFIGDCVLAAWHVGSSGTEAAIPAYAAAQEILVETENFGRQQWRYEAVLPWRCRVSLHSGVALHGSIGSGSAREFTLLGDTINTVFRLNDLGNEVRSSLILSKEVTTQLGVTTALVYRGAFALEGKKETVEVFTPPLGVA